MTEQFDTAIHYTQSKKAKMTSITSTHIVGAVYRGKTLDSFSEQVERDVAPQEGIGVPLSLTHSVRHEVAIPIDYHYIPLSNHIPWSNPAKEYAFTLDPFQSAAIHCIERNESVLVSAHTSAGKTVVAEYAIAMSLKQKQRVIYTSPIKALSNQKYRELYETFTDVGLMTGDVTINPTATCLVMTTEILRSMLYRGSEIMREVAWVIFDEIHYMRDKERGVVWEETIILLPNSVRYVFLSATIPNARQFAEWICEIHSQPCHVIYTDYRPTPLQHYFFPAGADGIYLVVDEKGTFREENFNKSLQMLTIQDDISSKQTLKKKSHKGGHGSDLYKIVKMIMTKNYQPVIIFSFSKRECEHFALQLSKIDFHSEDEKKLVHTIFSNAIACLNEDDRKLPQIENILPLLKRGVGIHHGGLLPILKEVIEILFQEGLLKVLFATETFSIGLNMPAKTVVFTNVRKFDGKIFRWITSGEYIQMSGRAGRRGLDDRGIVILMLDEKLEPLTCKSMIKGEADPLNSAFHLTYNMILNMLRVEEMNPEYMLEKSFFQFQNNASLPILESQLESFDRQRDELLLNDQEESVCSLYHLLINQQSILEKDIHQIMFHPSNIISFIQSGRLVLLKGGYDWGCIVGISRKLIKSDGDNQVNMDVLVYCNIGDTENIPYKNGEKGEMRIINVSLEMIDNISSIRIYLPNDVKSVESRQSVWNSIREVKRRFIELRNGDNGTLLPLLDPLVDMKIQNEDFKEMLQKCNIIKKKYQEMNELHKFDGELFRSKYKVHLEKCRLQDEMTMLKKNIKQATSIMQMEELKCRKRVLRRLGYTTAFDVIEMKGRVACEISTGDELLLTEMIFNGVFNDLTVEQCVALLSCFVFDEKSEEVVKLKDELDKPLRQMQEAARRIAQVSLESKLNIDEEEYIASFRPDLMDVVYAWCTGSKFFQICKMTDIFEGSIIRCMRRLEELLRQMCQASKSVGSTELENKFAEGINKLKRDIVFANSLYL